MPRLDIYNSVEPPPAECEEVTTTVAVSALRVNMVSLKKTTAMYYGPSRTALQKYNNIR